MSDQQFFYDDFFVDEEAGEELVLTLRGRSVPVRVRPGISSPERARIASKHSTRVLDHATGQVKEVKLNEAAFEAELMAYLILDWPFIYPPSHAHAGQKVEITPATCRKMLAQANDQIAAYLASGEKAQAAQLVPFVSTSETA